MVCLWGVDVEPKVNTRHFLRHKEQEYCNDSSVFQLYVWLFHAKKIYLRKQTSWRIRARPWPLHKLPHTFCVSCQSLFKPSCYFEFSNSQKKLAPADTSKLIVQVMQVYAPCGNVAAFPAMEFIYKFDPYLIRIRHWAIEVGSQVIDRCVLSLLVATSRVHFVCPNAKQLFGKGGFCLIMTSSPS